MPPAGTPRGTHSDRRGSTGGGSWAAATAGRGSARPSILAHSTLPARSVSPTGVAPGPPGWVCPAVRYPTGGPLETTSRITAGERGPRANLPRVTAAPRRGILAAPTSFAVGTRGGGPGDGRDPPPWGIRPSCPPGFAYPATTSLNAVVAESHETLEEPGWRGPADVASCDVATSERLPLRPPRRQRRARALPRRRRQPRRGGGSSTSATASRAKLEKVVKAPSPPTPKTVIAVGVASDRRPSRNDPVTLTTRVPTTMPLRRFHLRPASARASVPTTAAATKVAAVTTAAPPTES